MSPLYNLQIIYFPHQELLGYVSQNANPLFVGKEKTTPSIVIHSKVQYSILPIIETKMATFKVSLKGLIFFLQVKFVSLLCIKLINHSFHYIVRTPFLFLHLGSKFVHGQLCG
jgi:hypothetical protein